MKASELIKRITDNQYDEKFSELYSDIAIQKIRYINLIDKYIELYGDDDILIFSAPGRSEIGGNHTDHQHGKVLACAIDLDMACVLSFADNGIIELTSEGFGTSIVDINDLSVKEEEKGTTASLIRGITDAFVQRGLKVQGFKACMVSDVLGGSGLSSSAAFESLIGTIFSKGLNNGTVSDIEISKIGQYAENVYFGKPCGLMDQMAASCGGFVYIDFKDEPKVEKIDFNLSEYGYRLCVIDTRASHASLTDEYASIPSEMKLIAQYFGKEYLNEIDEEEFYKNISELRKLNNDRAILRAHHFLSENKRVSLMTEALRNKDIDTFFELVKRSG
ncbi:MAG: galactokinase, partial [Erysipelotrichaceae bacterium]